MLNAIFSFISLWKINKQISMFHLDLYMLTTLLSSAAILIMGVCLGVVSVPKDSELKNYRISRRFLSVAYILLALIGQLEILGDIDENGRSVLAFTIIGASYQSMLFTFSIITLINMSYMTRKRVLYNLIPITLLSIILLTVSEKVFYTIFYIATGLYCMQLIIYIWMFVKEYGKYTQRLDNFFSENEERRAVWIKQSFYMAACVGIVAIVSLFLNKELYTIFTVLYAIFYIYFGIKYINYVTLFHRIALAVATPLPDHITPVDRQTNQTNEDIGYSIEQWIARKEFLIQGITLESLAKDLYTNQFYLSRYINSTYRQNFRSWISFLRITESQQLLINRSDLTIIEIGEAVGIPSSSSFYRHFQSVTGMTPQEYRKQYAESPFAD